MLNILKAINNDAKLEVYRERGFYIARLVHDNGDVVVEDGPKGDMQVQVKDRVYGMALAKLDQLCSELF